MLPPHPAVPSPLFFPPLSNALLCGSCPMEGEAAVARLVETPPNDGDAREVPKEDENGAEGAAAAEELAASRGTGDSRVPPGCLRPNQDTARLDRGEGECWG